MDRLFFPQDHQRVMPYLVIAKAEEFIRFMQNVFGAKLEMSFESDDDVIAQAELTIGDSVIMLSATRNYFCLRLAALLFMSPTLMLLTTRASNTEQFLPCLSGKIPMGGAEDLLILSEIPGG
jgi:uncharacterized glyoxalase superfamily protein PhnB